MDEKKQEDTSAVLTGPTPETTTTEVVSEAEVTTVTETDPVSVSVPEVTEDSVTPAPAAFNYKMYIGAVVGIIVICSGLLFVLEKEGRISTGLFAEVITKMEARIPAAKVNGITISKTEFESSLEQLTQMSASQGADPTDAALIAELRTQAIDTLVNAELLRQAALGENMSVTTEEIEGRLTEIRDGLGGQEALVARMAEFNVTETSLRRDIENEYLIKQLLAVKVDTKNIEVTDDEVEELYNEAGGTDGGLPPLKDVREQVMEQIRFNKEQMLVTEYIDTLRTDAEIEILI